MKPEEQVKLNREWGQWKRRMLSRREKKNLSFAMFLDFLACKGRLDVILKRVLRE